MLQCVATKDVSIQGSHYGTFTNTEFVFKVYEEKRLGLLLIQNTFNSAAPHVPSEVDLELV